MIKKIILYSILILSISIASIGMIFVKNPNNIVNNMIVKKTFKTLVNIYSNSTWEKLDVNLKKHDLENFDLNLNFFNLCIVDKLVNACFKEISISSTFYIKNVSNIKMKSLNHMIVKKGTIRIEKPKSKSQKINVKEIIKTILKKHYLPGIVEDTTVNDINISVPNVIIEDSVSFGLDIRSNTLKNNKSLSWIIKANSQVMKIKLKIKTDNSIGDMQKSYIIKEDISFKLDHNKELQILGLIKKEKDKKIEHDTDIVYSLNNSKQFKISTKGFLDDGKIKGNLDFSLLQKNDYIKQIELSECNYSTSNLNSFISQYGTISLKCNVQTKMKYKTPIALRKLKLPKKINTRVDISLNFPLLINTSSSISSKYSLTFDKIETELYTVDGKIEGSINKLIIKEIPTWNKSISFNFDSKIKSFKKLKEKMESTNYQIPAPFNTLDGEIKLKAHGSFNPFKYGSKLPITVESKLESKTQKIDINGNGMLSFIKSLTFGTIPHVDLNLNLNKVILAAPKIDVESRSLSFIPDPRFDKDKGFFSRKHPFSFNIEISNKNNPIEIISNLSKNKIPLFLNLKLNQKDQINMKIKFAKTTFKLFKWDASIENLDIHLDRKKESLLIDGKINITTPNHLISIRIVEDLKSSRIVLDSQPQMSEQEIIATLLFGKPLSTLSSSQNTSTAAFQSAVAEGALNLSSLLIFSSLPIESFSYDPQNEIYSAKIDISKGNGAYLHLGKGKNSQSVGLQYKISDNFIIETIYTNKDQLEDNQHNNSSTSTFLEWIKRY